MPQTTLRVPYTQQFSPGQTPLSQLLPILRQSTKKEQLRQAISGAFFSESDNSEKLAGNTLLALRAYGIINDSDELDFFGKELIACQGKPDIEAHKALARHIIFEMDGIVLVETLRDMNQASMEITLTSMSSELQKRGLAVNESSSDLSAVLGWLREAKILDGYTIDYDQFQKVTGFSVETLNIAKKLSVEQFMFLRGMVALNVEDWVSYEIITNHAEGIYVGQVKYNRKSIVKSVIEPLRKAGLIEFRKRIKEDTSTPEGRGGKPGDVKPTEYFNKTFADPFLEALFRAAGFNDLREIRSRSISSILADIEQTADMDKSGKALEILAVRLCQLLELDFLGWRETDTDLTGGGEVDAMLHSTDSSIPAGKSNVRLDKLLWKLLRKR